MNELEKEELPFERVLFFSDAIVAIAITLLALELKVDVPEGKHLSFTDLIKPWHHYLAFFLSFINIAGFWNTHHRLFCYIKKMDERLKWYNMAWLFLIVTLPFSTSVLSDHFGDTAAVFLYALNIFLISAFQNFLWDYSVQDGFVDSQTFNKEQQQRFNVVFNLDMLNGLVAIGVSFFAPVVAFILLYFKIPLMLFSFFYLASLRRKMPGNGRRGFEKMDRE
jgi:uncharacterized membrane protein